MIKCTLIILIILLSLVYWSVHNIDSSWGIVYNNIAKDFFEEHTETKQSDLAEDSIGVDMVVRELYPNYLTKIKLFQLSYPNSHLRPNS